MKRRIFISNSLLISSGLLITGNGMLYSRPFGSAMGHFGAEGLFDLFSNPGLEYHPWVRWWWNGNKVEAGELVRELRLLKAAGIGGVEINPVEFPTRFEGDDLGKPSIQWLSDEWIDLLKVVFDEARQLGMGCDLIVGSGWPFGAEYLEGEDRAQVVVIAVKKITGPAEYQITREEIFREADPAVSSPFQGRSFELLSISLIPDPVGSRDEVIRVSPPSEDETIRISIPSGDHAVYCLVKIHGFMEVINGAPGATGPVLNHFNSDAVNRYLTRMSETIEKRIGPLSKNLRALFTDSMELEGSNWTAGMAEEFIVRRGYDIMPWLPFLLFRTGSMGNITDRKYGAVMSSGFEEMINRMRYDFEITRAELLNERFIEPYIQWCRDLKVKSRAQAYGRGLFPLESSFSYDIPEGESWTMNWLKHRIGEEMPEEDYRRGRAYTMINKYVSSAAHLTGKRVVSCEEMTDTYTVFNTSLENLKIGTDQSTISGITHSVLHGFNYSPPDAPWPGWIRYGAYYNENNTWWPWFRHFNEYKGRLSAALQHATMFTDIAILPPQEDMWSLIGSQMEPFPSITHVDWMTLVWEAIHKSGNGCDYVSERVIREAEMAGGWMHYGPKKYHTLFLVQVDSLAPETAARLLDFVKAGGRIFCIETVPGRSTGWKDHKERDLQVAGYVEKMKSYCDRFIILKRPERDFISWFGGLQSEYGIKPYVRIGTPDPFVYQNRYTADDGAEMVFVINSHLHNSHKTRIEFSEEIAGGKQGWLWFPEDGTRRKISLDEANGLLVDMGPAESFLFVFDNETGGEEWRPLPETGDNQVVLDGDWSAEFIHCHNGSVVGVEMGELKDLLELPDFVHFAGTVTYRMNANIEKRKGLILNLGKVYGVSELRINGELCGVKWFGRRIFDVGGYLKRGKNSIEIKVATSMGNYMKSLTGNRVAQYWTNEKNKVQPLQSMGLVGPVTCTKRPSAQGAELRAKGIRFLM
jgi:hypothetical protein